MLLSSPYPFPVFSEFKHGTINDLQTENEKSFWPTEKMAKLTYIR